MGCDPHIAAQVAERERLAAREKTKKIITDIAEIVEETVKTKKKAKK